MAKRGSVIARGLVAASALSLICPFPAHATANPCAEPKVAADLITDFNATAAAQSRALRIVAVTKLTTLYRIGGKLFCHGTVLDNQGADTPMTITMSAGQAGGTMWVLRLDEAATPIGLTQ